MATCNDCGAQIGLLNSHDGLCGKCYEARKEAKQKALEDARAKGHNRTDRDIAIDAVLVTTEATAPDIQIERRLGIVTAEVVIGMHLFKDITIGVRNTVGGRSETYQKDLRQMRQDALYELKREAHDIGADAVVAVDLDYQEIGSKANSMLMLVASGTAVKVAAPQEL